VDSLLPAAYDRASRRLRLLHVPSNIPTASGDVLLQVHGIFRRHAFVVVALMSAEVSSGTGSLYHEETGGLPWPASSSGPLKFHHRPIGRNSPRRPGVPVAIDAPRKGGPPFLPATRDGFCSLSVPKWIGDVGAYSSIHGPLPWNRWQVGIFMPGPYRLDAYRGRIRGVLTPKPPTGRHGASAVRPRPSPWRRLIGWRPEIVHGPRSSSRRRNLVRRRGFLTRNRFGDHLDKSAFQTALKEPAGHFGYGSLLAERDAARAEGRWGCIGLANPTPTPPLCGLNWHRSRISFAPGMPHNTGTENLDDPDRCYLAGITAVFGIQSHGQA